MDPTESGYRPPEADATQRFHPAVDLTPEPAEPPHAEQAPRHAKRETGQYDLEAVERCRATLLQAADVQHDPAARDSMLGMGRATLEDSLWLTEVGPMSAAAARELVASADEFNRLALRYDDHSFEAVLAKLKTNVYGDANIEPAIPKYDKIGPRPRAYGEAADVTGENRPLVGVSRTLEWQGAPIRLRTVSEGSENPYRDPKTTSESVIALRPDERGAWFMQIGDGRPFELEAGQAFTVGRSALAGPVGGNNNISATHLTIRPVSKDAIEIIDHSTHGTQNQTPEWPLPADEAKFSPLPQSKPGQHHPTEML